MLPRDLQGNEHGRACKVELVLWALVDNVIHLMVDLRYLLLSWKQGDGQRIGERVCGIVRVGLCRG
jgi:hypothetical protein